MDTFSSLRWKTHEYRFNEKSADWFWGLGLGVTVIAVASVIFKDVLLAILIVIAGFAVGLLAIRRPREIDFELNKKGVRAGSDFHAWSSLKSFWLEERSDPAKIIFVSKKIFLPHLILPVGDVDLEEVHAVLLHHLPQVEHHESFVDIISERLGF